MKYAQTKIEQTASGRIVIYGRNPGEAWQAIATTYSTSEAVDIATDRGGEIVS